MNKAEWFPVPGNPDVYVQPYDSDTVLVICPNVGRTHYELWSVPPASHIREDRVLIGTAPTIVRAAALADPVNPVVGV